MEDCLNSSQVYLYPNPAGNELTVEISVKEDGITTLLITDLLGKTIKTEELNLQKGNNIFKISLEELASGMYFVTLAGNKTVSQKLVVSH